MTTTEQSPPKDLAPCPGNAFTDFGVVRTGPATREGIVSVKVDYLKKFGKMPNTMLLSEVALDDWDDPVTVDLRKLSLFVTTEFRMFGMRVSVVAGNDRFKVMAL